MFETKAQAMNNCFTIVKGSTPMSRDFGAAVVDSPAISTVKREITIQLSTFYPEVSIESINVTADGGGNFIYDIKVAGD